MVYVLWGRCRSTWFYPANNLGSRRERMGIEQHATYIISFESYSVNTGDLRKDAKAGGSRKARAVRNADAFLRSRMGHNSLSPGKLGTPGRGLMAKAPSLGKYGVQRYVANTVPSERASCALAVWRGYAGEMGSNTDERL